MNWIFYAVFTAILWAICYTSVEQVIKTVDKLTYITISSIIILAICGIVGRNKFLDDLSKITENTNNVSIWLFAAITASIIGTYMSIMAIETSNASLAASLEITYPFWCMVIAFLLFGQTMSVMSIFGVVIIFAGVIMVICGR
jgi:drug/metabolite transporter (DMT)-like permease